MRGRRGLRDLDAAECRELEDTENNEAWQNRKESAAATEPRDDQS